MFKVLVMLDCDECGVSLSHARVFSSTELACPEVELPMMTELQVKGIQKSSSWHGWQTFRNHSICPNCIREEEKMAGWYSDEEEYRS